MAKVTDTLSWKPGSILKCKGWETDPNAYIYFITQAAMWPAVCKVIGEESWVTDEAYAMPGARLLHLKPIFERIEQWTTTRDKLAVMEILNQCDIPCGSILSTGSNRPVEIAGHRVGGHKNEGSR